MFTAVLNHRVPPPRFLAPPQSAAVTPPGQKAQLAPSRRRKCNLFVAQSLSSSSSSPSPKIQLNPSTRLFVSGLSFRTTEEGLRNAFENFGELVEVKLVMDKMIANRSRGFAFVRYATDEGSRKAIQGMHGKFLDGRVIFVEIARPTGDLRQGIKPNT